MVEPGGGQRKKSRDRAASEARRLRAGLPRWELEELTSSASPHGAACGGEKQPTD